MPSKNAIGESLEEPKMPGRASPCRQHLYGVLGESEMPAVKTMNLNDFLDLPSSEQRKFLFDARIFRGNFDTVAWEWWPQADWSHCWILLVWYFARHVR